jgi:hypothetical protein
MKSVCFSIVLWVSCLRSVAFELYIAPDGNDAWSGTRARPNAARTDGPLASLQGARDKLRQREHRAETARVIIAKGTYVLKETFVLTPEDSGTAEYPVIYEAAKGAKPVFTGGVALTGWKKEGNGLWSTHIPEVAAGRWTFEQLWVNGRRATRARHPNRGFFRVASVSENPIPPDESRQEKVPAFWTRQTIGLNEADSPALAGMSAQELGAVQVVAYHYWETTRRYLNHFDPVTGVLTFDALRKHAYAGVKVGSRYQLENARAFLDAPGEWFLAADGVLYYLPRAGEDMRQADVVAPRLENFLVLEGDAANGRLVEHVVFKGLAFKHSQWLTPPSGVRPFQASTMIDATVLADGAQHVVFEDCEIAHTGKYALWLRQGCQAVRVQRCLFRDLGAGGIRIGEDFTSPEPTGNIEIDNNIITGGGRIFASAPGIWIGRSSDNQVTHNDVSDFYHNGISVGWQWGYAESTAARNRIAFNRIHHLGWGLMSDLGGIYTLGVSPGTECFGNVIHDIAGADYGGWGIYFDEGSSGVMAANNLVYGTTHGGFHQHYGKDNSVLNNVFALGRNAQLRLTRVEPHLSFTFEHNIVYWQRGVLFDGEWSRARIQADRNLYFMAAPAAVPFDREALHKVQVSGQDEHSLVADPLFRDPARQDFVLSRGSPAVPLGFVPFGTQQAGIRNWAASAAAFTKPMRPDWLERDPFSPE